MGVFWLDTMFHALDLRGAPRPPFTGDHGPIRPSHPTCMEWDGGWVGGVPRGSFSFALWLLMLMRLAWEDDDEREEDIPYPRLLFFLRFFWERGYVRASIQIFLDGLRCERPNEKVTHRDRGQARRWSTPQWDCGR